MNKEKNKELYSIGSCNIFGVQLQHFWGQLQHFWGQLREVWGQLL